ncbi:MULTISPECIES: hypothetical protein [Pseudomonas]|uniref:hypothetical protein n=1 Tax=Pseudomonas TaxID=286 RepID=UPI00398FB6B8
MSKLIKFFNHWAPGIVYTLLGYFLSKGVLDGFGQTFVRSWAATQEWGVEPIFYPRWFVLSGATTILIGGVYLFWKQYKRVQELEKGRSN